MATEPHVTLARPEDLPSGISDESRKLLEQYLEAHKEQQRLQTEQAGEVRDTEKEWDRTSNKVNKTLCNLMQELHDDGLSGSDITEVVPVSSHNTVYYHLRGDCDHDYRAQITYDECGWMRAKAQEGKGTPELSDEYSVTKHTVSVHVTGKCQHEDGIEPISGKELFRNSRKSDRWTTSVCPICGDEFKHKDYRERTTCSDECNVKYASDMSKVSASAGD